jgi:hypothetical protein
MKTQSIRLIVALALTALLVAGCAGTQKASESSFKTPTVTLNRAEIPSYFGFWFYNSKVQPSLPAEGKPGNNGAPLIYAFVFDIQNPNEFPVLMNNMKFTVALDGFDLNTVASQDDTWVPAGKTTQLRVPCVLGPWEAFLSLGVVGGTRLKQEGKKPWDLIQTWWIKAPDFSFPLEVREGSAVFTADGITKVAPFKAKYP